MKVKNRNIVKIISIICATIFFALTFVLIFQFVNIANLTNKKKNLNKQLSNLEEQIINYTNESDYLNSNEFLEDYARENLGWGKNGEMIFK